MSFVAGADAARASHPFTEQDPCPHSWEMLRIGGGWGAANCAYLICEGCGEGFALDLADLWMTKAATSTEEDRKIRAATDAHFSKNAAHFYATKEKGKR